MKQKIFFMIPSLAGGGAERVFVNLIKEIDKSSFDVTLIYLSDERNVYKAPSNIRVISLNVKRLRNAPFKAIRLIRKERPDLIVSTLGHMNLMLLVLKRFLPKKTKLIVRLTNIPSMNLSDKWIKRSIQKKMLSIYSLADKVICQSEFMRSDFIKTSRISNSKVVKIYNPTDVDSILLKANEDVGHEFIGEHRNICYVGRLEDVKRIPLIIDAFQKYNYVQPKSKLYLIGEGPKENELTTYVKKKNLTKSVHLLGFQSNPYKWLKHADLFIMASKHEGMPNVLLEALALELPVIILKHPGGTEDIMKSLKIEDRFVDELLISESNFNKYNDLILPKLIDNFGVKNIIKQYENVFMSVITGEN